VLVAAVPPIEKKPIGAGTGADAGVGQAYPEGQGCGAGRPVSLQSVPAEQVAQVAAPAAAAVPAAQMVYARSPAHADPASQG